MCIYYAASFVTEISCWKCKYVIQLCFDFTIIQFYTKVHELFHKAEQ